MTLYIIRHGETEMNRRGIVQGSGIDSELNKIGHNQAYLFFQYYKNVHFDYIITSALKRTHQTVQPFLKRGTHKKWIKMPELNEISWGVHEGQTSNAMSNFNYKQLMSDWDSGVYDSKIKNGESASQLHIRVTKVIESLKNNEKLNRKNILVCTHGRTLLCLLTILSKKPLSTMSQFKHQNTCLYKVHFIDNEFIFECENDIRHLLD